MNLYRILLNLCLTAPVCTAYANSMLPAGEPTADYQLVGERTDPAKRLYREGLRMQRSGRLDEAQQHFEAAIRENSSLTAAYIALAGVYRQLQQPEPAKQQLVLALEKAPANGECWATLAMVHVELRSWEDALTCAFRAQELGRPQMDRIIGLSYSYLNHPEEAILALEKAHKTEKLGGEDLCRLARLHAQQEAYNKSIQYYEEALQAGGNPPAVYYELGMMYFNMKNYKHAAGAFEQATRLGRPADAELYLNLGMAHLKQAAYDDAISNLQTALSLRPKDIQAMISLANAYFKKQDFQQAAIQWNKILMLQPQNAFAMFMLGKSYMGCGQLVKGQAICDQAMEMQ